MGHPSACKIARQNKQAQDKKSSELLRKCRGNEIFA
jgi:hypothetical protein